MPIRNRRPDLNGLLVVDKPLGWSSAKVCAHVRRVSGGAKVGHAGTLDPLATGVLVVALGRATKAIAGIQATEKRYVAEVDLSAFTDTDDAEGEREEIEVAALPGGEVIEAALRSHFTGAIEQTPPVFSAIKLDGERAYRMARRGDREAAIAKLEARTVTIHEIALTAYAWPIAALDIRCSKGTYIRSLARDLGRVLGTGGTLASLRRTAVGEYTIDRAVTPGDLPEPMTPGDVMPVPIGL
ncbi:MAG: tRNA pseudouridine(55) synthase TruB [Planctomycetota bacterium]